MVNQKGKKRSFQGMSYHEVQRVNSKNRSSLKSEDQKWLKQHSFKNVGWDNVIALYQQIEEFLGKYRLEDLTLDELFLEADRIGSKYQTSEEIEAFNQQYAQAVSEVEATIDRHFPDTEIEILDFSGQPHIPSRYKAKNVKR